MQRAPAATQNLESHQQLAVLLVEGNEESLILCVTAMGRRGHRVTAAASGREGFRFARSQAFDAIVVSHKLPDISGIDLLKALRERQPQTPVICVVPTGAEDIVLKALDSGAAAYLVRTPRFHELLPALVEEQVAELRRGRRLELEERAHAKDVEELRRIEAALTGTEARLQVLLEQAPIVLWTVDKDLRITSIAGASLASFGGSRGEAVGLALSEFFQTEDPEFGAVAAHRRVLEGEPAQLDMEGSGRKFEVHLSPLRSPTQEIIGVVGAAFDVTDQRAAEEELRRSEERFHLLGRATNDMVWDWDLVTDAVWRNEAVTTILGYTAEEIQPNGTWWDGLIHPEDVDRGLSRMRAAIQAGGNVWSEEYRVRRKDGTYATVLERGFIIRDEAGKPLRMVGSTMDLSKRKRTEEVQRAIYRISEAATSAGDLGTLYQTIHSIVGELMPATNFYIALVDREARTISFPYFVDEFEEPPGPQPPGRGLTEYVIRTGKPILATPAVFDELVQAREVELIGPPSIDWLGVPLVVGAETIGAIVVQTYKEGVRYGEEERDILAFVSDQIANAIDRKRTEEMVRSRDAILEAARFAADAFLKAEGWEDRVPDVLRRLGEAAQVSRVWILQNARGPDGTVRTRQTFEWAAPGIASFLDPPSRPSRAFRETGFDRWEEALSRGEIIVGNPRDFPERERTALAAQDIQSILVVPVSAASGWWGAIGFDQCDRQRAWTLPEVDALRTAAGTLAAAIERSETERIIRYRAAQQAAVANFGALVLRGASVPDLFQEASQIVAKVLDVEYCGILEMLPSGRGLLFRAGVGWGDDQIGQIRPIADPAGAPGYAAMSQGATVVGDFEGELGPQTPPDLRARGIVSGATVPIQGSGRNFGVLGAHTTRHRSFTSDDVNFLHAIANMLATALGRGEAEQALRESEARYRRLAENALDVIYRYRITEPPGFEFVSPAVTAMTGFTPEEHYADPDFGMKIVHPEDRPILEAAIRSPEVLRKPLFLRWIRKDGTTVWTEQRNVPILDEEGNLVAIEGIARDITERRWAEEAVRQSEERYRILFENNPQPMLVYDFETLRILAVNEAAIRHYGYTRDEFLSLTVKDLRPAGDLPRFMEILKDVSPGIQLSGIWRHVKKDGSVIDVDIVSHGLDFGGRPARLVLITDVTERRRGAEALERSERRFRTLFESAADGIFLLDPKGLILDVNSAAERLFGLPRARIIGKNMADFIPEGELDRSRHYLRDVLKGHRQDEAFEMNVATPDGRRHSLEVRSRFVREDPAHVYVESIVRDVTEQKEMQRRLLETERLASMGQIAGYVAHEINNPLANMSLLVASIQRRTKDAEILEKLEKINSQRRHAASIIADILSFSKQREPQTEEVDLRKVIGIAAEQVATSRKESVRLVAQLGTAPIRVSVDPLQMQEVFMNLLKNAFEATETGSVTVRATVGEEAVRVSVEDTGPGVPPEVLDRIFQPFVTTKRKTGGTGLGLALCKSVVAAHGGQIEASSRPGEGATFTVTLPRGGVHEDPHRR